MIAHVLGVPPFDGRLLNPADLQAALRDEAPHRLIYDHLDFDAHAPILDQGSFPELRIVLLYRNPIDAAISAFHRFAALGPLPAEELEPLDNFRLYLNGHWQSHTLPEAYRDNPMLTVSFRQWVQGRAVGWLRAGRCLAVRYEDLITDTKLHVRRTLDHLRAPYTDGPLDQAIARHSFHTLSGGREPGTLDPTSHYRRGVPGEWREVLDDYDVEALHQELGDYLDLLGYDLAPDMEDAEANGPTGTRPFHRRPETARP